MQSFCPASAFVSADSDQARNPQRFIHGTGDLQNKQPTLQTRVNEQEMTDCKLQIAYCKNLVLRTAKTGKFAGQKFFGCKNYPNCSYLIPLHFDENAMTDLQKELAKAFGLFVRSNYFIYATYGVVYYNLRQAAFMDYLLRTDIVYSAANVEIGLTSAKVYQELFSHLFLIPSNDIKRYLINNFPKTYSNLYRHGPIHTLLGNVSNYESFAVDETEILQYKDIETYNR